MDKDGYLEQEELDKIASWPAGDYSGLMEYIRDRWTYAKIGYFSVVGTVQKGRYCLSTGGWSGNEAIIEALQCNAVFWLMCWESSRRGGHYEFEVKS